MADNPLIHTLQTDVPYDTPNHPAMIVVHMDATEVQALEEMQGGLSIDPSTGIPEFSRLDTIFDEPGVRGLLEKIAVETKENGHPDPEILETYDLTKDKFPRYRNSEENELGVEIAHEGINGDTKLVLIPERIADFFDTLRSETDINPKTGLREYGFGSFFKNIVKVAAPIVGAVFGGPLGGAVGGALGQGIASKGNVGRMLTGGALGGLGGMAYSSLTGGGTGLGSMFGSSGRMVGPGYGYVSGATPGLHAELASHGMLPGMASVGNGMGLSHMAGAAGVGSMMSGMGRQPSSQSFLGSALDFLRNNPLVPALGIGGLHAYGAIKGKKKEEELRKENNRRTGAYLKHHGL